MSPLISTLADFRRRYPIRPYDPAMLLGSGSYGKVVKVEDQLETEWVAVKISAYKGVPEQSLQAEVELAQRMPRQANIARYDACYRLETDTGLCDFAVMKYYHDGNLATLLKRERLTPQQTFDLAKGILLGLQHLHRHRIVHRDFKPANILISRDNQGRLVPKIADFGLSKLVDDEAVDQSDFELSDGRGTPSYKAPEQIEGGRVSYNLDLWAFGVVLYEMLLGEKPFAPDDRAGSEQAVRRLVEVKIMSATIPGKLEQIGEPYRSIIKRCLVRNIHERARQAAELLDLLESGASQQGGTINQSDPAEADELTDVYAEEVTDVFGQTDLFGRATDLTELLPAGVVVLPAEPLAGANPTPLPNPPDEPVAVPVTQRRPVGLSWRVVVPVAAVLSGVGFYTYLSNPSEATPTPTRQLIAQRAQGPSATVSAPTSETPVSAPAPNTEDGVDALVHKARTAYYRHQYPQAIQWAERGLNLSPKRQDLLLIKTQAQDRVVKTAKPLPTAAPTATSAAVAANNVPTAAIPAPPTEKEKAQQTYEALLEQGAKAIANGNRKSDAMNAFNEARQLTTTNVSASARSRELYKLYMGKGDRIFDNEEYKGALAWYQVAQAIDNTPEIRTKIKACTQNQ